MSRLANHRPARSAQRNIKRKTRTLAIHEDNPAGSKRARRIAKAILRSQRAIEKRRSREPDTPKPRSNQISYERALVVGKKHAALFQRG